LSITPNTFDKPEAWIARKWPAKTFAGKAEILYANQHADVAELVDARDLKLHSLAENRRIFCQTPRDFTIKTHRTERDLSNTSARVFYPSCILRVVSEIADRSSRSSDCDQALFAKLLEMTDLTRRRDRTSRQETWRIYYGDVRVGTISQHVGAQGVNDWGWSCGFYPGMEPPHHEGAEATFELARAAFEKCWQRTLPTLTQAQFDKWRFNRDSTAWKYAMWDARLKMPTQTQDGRARCFCGADITIASTDAHIRAAHRMTDGQIR
jgi:hypothetical protein